MDNHTPEQRSRNMSAVRGKNTKPEIVVRRWLHAAGYRFRLHVATLPGCPDIVLPRYRTAIFVHGCFWHQHPGCLKATRPTSNRAFWDKKLDENIQRDITKQAELRALGWNVVVIWECSVKEMIKTNPEFIPRGGETGGVEDATRNKKEGNK